MIEPIIVLENLHKTFRDFWLRPIAEAVRGVSLTINRGEVFGLLGPNGSGKSTTLKMLLGLLKPTAGRVKLFGLPPRAQAARKRLGYLPELSYLHPFLTARETIAYYAGLSNLKGADREKRIKHLLDEVNLTHAANRPVGGFSKGMARRVAFAAALVAEPELLILDEPTSGLDPLGIREVKVFLKRLAEKGTTILVTSHQLFDMQDICTRVAILSQGRITGGGPMDEIVAAAQDKRHALEDYFLSKVAPQPSTPKS